MMAIDDAGFVRIQVPRKPPPMLVVRNLSDKVNNEMLRELFAPYNPKRCQVVYRNNRPKGWAGIEFENENDATRAKEALQRKVLDGREITILDAKQSDRDWFTNKKPNTRPGRQSGFDVPPPNIMGRGAPPPGGRGGRWGGPPPGGPFPVGSPMGRQPDQFSPPPHQLQQAPHQMQEFPPFQQSPQHFLPIQQHPPRPAMHSPLPQQVHPDFHPLGSILPGAVVESDDKPTDFASIKDLKHHKFYIIEFQFSWEVQGSGIPCEMAVVALTCGEGEVSVFHRFINPGHIPICYVPNAINQSNVIHSIPHHSFQHAEKNYSKLWNELLRYLDPDLTGVLPILYAKAPVAKSNAITWLAQKAGQPNPLRPVRPIEEILDYFHSISTISMHSSAIQDYFGSVNAIQARGKCNHHDLVSQGLSDTGGGPHNAQCALANARVCCDILKAAFERLRIEERLASRS